MLPAFPPTVDDLTPAWFTSVLDREVTAAEVVDRSSGTTGRALVALHGDPGLPARVFVKLPPFHPRQRELVDKTGMGVTEARFYRDLAGKMPVRVPAVVFADTDGAGYVMVLEDLGATGCTFPRPDDPDVATRAADIVGQLAVLHAPYWESPRFAPDGDLHWLVDRGTRGGSGGRFFVENAVREIGAEMDATWHRLAELYLAHTEEIVAMWRSGPRTLVHGDDHSGNLFIDPSLESDVGAAGRTGFLDWAVVQAGPGMRDVSYVLCNSVPVDVRGGDRATPDRRLLRPPGRLRDRVRPGGRLGRAPHPRRLLVAVGRDHRGHGLKVAAHPHRLGGRPPHLRRLRPPRQRGRPGVPPRRHVTTMRF